MKSAFSLMEMMVVLLIVAVVAAATAPMVTKKMARSTGSGDSPWLFTGTDGNIAYNMNKANISAIIGASSYSNDDNEPTHPRLVIASGADANRPALAFADQNGKFSGQINMNKNNGVVALNNSLVGNNSVAVGMGQTTSTTDDSVTSTYSGIVAIGQGVTTTAENAIAIGQGTIATAEKAVAIGRSTEASGIFSTAIGDEAKAQKYGSLAIGKKTTASHEYSTAIGYKAETTASYQIVLGTKSDTVYIPGHLVVGDVFVNNISDSQTAEGLMYSGTEDWTQGGVTSNINKFITARNVIDNNGLRAAKVKPVQIPYWARQALSDRRLKNVGEKYTAGLDELKKLDFYHYTFKKDEAKTPMVGVMAQDLQKVFPDAVKKGDDGFLRIRLEDMFFAVINAVKELDTRINDIKTSFSSKLDAQEQRIANLEKQNAELQKENSELKEDIKAIKKRINKLEK